MNTASPNKRRAALAALDANAMTSTTPTSTKPQNTTPDAALLPRKPEVNSRRSFGLLASAPVLAPPTPASSAPGSNMPSVGMKRASGVGMVLPDDPAEQETESPAAKKSKLDEQEDVTPASTQMSSAAEERSRTHSPDASSVFDNSGAEDATWVTTATEPDVLAMHAALPSTVVVARPPQTLTREQAREKVEILRLRLGLASYKLRTGQISIPLADLQARPLPTTTTTTTAAIEAMAAEAVAETVENTPNNSQDEDDDEEDVVAATPPASTATVSAST